MPIGEGAEIRADVQAIQLTKKKNKAAKAKAKAKAEAACEKKKPGDEAPEWIREEWGEYTTPPDTLNHNPIPHSIFKSVCVDFLQIRDRGMTCSECKQIF